MTPSARPGSTSSAPHWVQLLAAAVVQQALCDACDRTLPKAIREEARQFLAGNPSYRFWCTMSEEATGNGHSHDRANGHAIPLPALAMTSRVSRLSV